MHKQPLWWITYLYHMQKKMLDTRGNTDLVVPIKVYEQNIPSKILQMSLKNILSYANQIGNRDPLNATSNTTWARTITTPFEEWLRLGSPWKHIWSYTRCKYEKKKLNTSLFHNTRHFMYNKNMSLWKLSILFMNFLQANVLIDQ